MHLYVIGFYQADFYSCEINRKQLHNVMLPIMWVATNDSLGIL